MRVIKKCGIARPGPYAALGVVMAFAGLSLYGCASAIDVSSHMPESAALPEGHGAVIGSILLSAPTEVLDVHQREMIDAFQTKTYEAIVGRFVTYGYGFASRTEHPGDRYSVSFEVGIKKPFVIRAPAGSYSFQEISQIIRGIFGEPNVACRMEGVANFDIHAGKTTYIGQLTIVAGFMSDHEVTMRQAIQTSRGVYVIGRPEAFLTMRSSAIDMKGETLRDLRMNTSGAAIGFDTELMRVGERKDNWNCVPPPIPTTPPGLQRNR